MQNTEQTITKIANYLNIKFTYPRREYESPMGKTRYVSRNIEEPLPTPTWPGETYTNQNEEV